jgi:hypothetical protein
VRAAFASGEDRIAGFLYIGTPGCIMEERQRPGIEEVFSTWDSQQLPLLE